VQVHAALLCMGSDNIKMDWMDPSGACSIMLSAAI
jgi:hypothetical protein